MSEFEKAFGGHADLTPFLQFTTFPNIPRLSDINLPTVDELYRCCCLFPFFISVLFFMINKKGQQNEKAKLEINTKEAPKERKPSTPDDWNDHFWVENYKHFFGVEPERYGHAEEFAGVLEDLMDADHESDPNLNLEESEFTEIIDEDEVEKAEDEIEKEEFKAALFFIIIIFLTFLLLDG